MGPVGRNTVFGKSLETCFYENRGACPQIFTESIRHLQEGLQSPGLFSGRSDKRKVQLLQRAWDQGRNPLKLLKILDVVAVSDCLVNWLLSLPAPVIPCKLFHAFLHVQRTCSHSQWVAQVHLLLDKLNHFESEIALPLLSLLHEYEQIHRGKDFRSVSLGQMFGPVLLKAHTNALPMPFPEDIQSVAELTNRLIVEYDAIFRPPLSPCSSPVKKPPTRSKLSSPPQKLFSQLQKQEEEKRQQFAAKMFGLETNRLKPLRVAPVIPQIDQTNLSASLDYNESLEAKLHGNLCENQATADLISRHRFLQGERLYVSEDAAFFQDQNKPPLNQLNSECSPGSSCSVNTEHRALGTSKSYALEGQDSELDTVVGDLLVGSLSGMLFEPDDEKFRTRTSVLMSANTSPSTSCVHSEASGEISSDEEFAHFVP